MTGRVIARLTRLLDVERTALLNGDLEAVGALVAEKEELAASFSSENAGELTLLSTALARNSRLFDAARDGLTTAMQSLRDQHAARTTLSGYDASGKPTQISRSGPGTERRY